MTSSSKPEEIATMQSDSDQLKSTATESNCVIYLGYGICRFWPNCKYNHPVPPKASVDQEACKNQNIPCKFYLAGMCKYRSYCSFDHSQPVDPRVQYNFYGLPLRPGEAKCSYYIRTGNCSYGAGCKFDHPEKWGNESSGHHVQSGNQGKDICWQFEKYGACKYGRFCSYDHLMKRNSNAQEGSSNSDVGGKTPEPQE